MYQFHFAILEWKFFASILYAKHKKMMSEACNSRSFAKYIYLKYKGLSTSSTLLVIVLGWKSERIALLLF